MPFADGLRLLRMSFFDLEIELQDSNKNLLMKTVAEDRRVHIVVLFGEMTTLDL